MFDIITIIGSLTCTCKFVNTAHTCTVQLTGNLMLRHLELPNARRVLEGSRYRPYEDSHKRLRVRTGPVQVVIDMCTCHTHSGALFIQKLRAADRATTRQVTMVD